jgi:hypothetical protein
MGSKANTVSNSDFIAGVSDLFRLVCKLVWGRKSRAVSRIPDAEAGRHLHLWLARFDACGRGGGGLMIAG